MTPTGSKKRKYDEFAGNDQKEETISNEVNEPHGTEETKNIDSQNTTIKR